MLPNIKKTALKAVRSEIKNTAKTLKMLHKVLSQIEALNSVTVGAWTPKRKALKAAQMRRYWASQKRKKTSKKTYKVSKTPKPEPIHSTADAAVN